MGDVHALPTADDALRALHSQIETLAARASMSYALIAPLRVEHLDGYDRHIWYESDKLTVLSEDGLIAIAPGPRFDHYPDYVGFTRADARQLAQALVSASAFVDQHPPADGGVY